MPTAEQTALLRAALLRGPIALEAWEQWQTMVHIDHLDAGSARLLPLLYLNLQAHGVASPLLPKLKGIYRHTWARNQLLLHTIAELVRSFHAANIPTVVLKGAALVPLYYPTLGARPMQDFDLLVPLEQVRAAMGLLQEWGWQASRPRPEALVAVYHSCSFVDAGGVEFDLHWHVLRDGCRPQDDAAYWTGTVPFMVGGEATRTLNAADHLLHACVHGALWNEVPPVRWVADAWLILNGAQPIDWARIVRLAHEQRLGVPLRATFHYLQRAWEAPIPSWVLEELEQVAPTRADGLEYWAKVGRRGLWQTGLDHWLHYRRLQPQQSFVGAVVRFPRYLQALLDADQLWQVPGQVLSKSRRRTRLLGMQE